MLCLVSSCLFSSFLASFDLWDSLLAMFERKEGWCRVRSLGCSIPHPWLAHENFRKALIFFRGEKYEFLQEELDEIANAEAHKEPSKKTTSTLSIMELLVFLKPFSAAMTIIFFRLSGFSVMSSYTATYLENAGINFDPLLGSIFIGTVRLLASLSTIVVLNVISKRTSITTFGVISTLSVMSGRLSRVHIKYVLLMINLCFSCCLCSCTRWYWSLLSKPRMGSSCGTNDQDFMPFKHYGRLPYCYAWGISHRYKVSKVWINQVKQ